MAVQKRKKIRHKLFAFLNAYCSKTHLIKALNSLDSSRQNRRLSQIPKKDGFRKLRPPKNSFKTCSAVHFPKKHAHFGGLETNQRHEL